VEVTINKITIFGVESRLALVSALIDGLVCGGFTLRNPVSLEITAFDHEGGWHEVSPLLPYGEMFNVYSGIQIWAPSGGDIYISWERPELEVFVGAAVGDDAKAAFDTLCREIVAFCVNNNCEAKIVLGNRST